MLLQYNRVSSGAEQLFRPPIYRHPGTGVLRYLKCPVNPASVTSPVALYLAIPRGVRDIHELKVLYEIRPQFEHLVADTIFNWPDTAQALVEPPVVTTMKGMIQVVCLSIS